MATDFQRNPSSKDSPQLDASALSNRANPWESVSSIPIHSTTET